MTSDSQAFRQVLSAFMQSLKVLPSFLGTAPDVSFDQNYCDENRIDGRCAYPHYIKLRPGCPHLTIAHELAHWMTLAAAEKESKRLGKSTSHLRVDADKVEELKEDSELFSTLHDLIIVAQSTPEISRAWETPGLCESSINDQQMVRAYIRPEEILANSIAQFVAEIHFPADLDFLAHIDPNATAISTEGYWLRPSFKKLKPLVSRL